MQGEKKKFSRKKGDIPRGFLREKEREGGVSAVERKIKKTRPQLSGKHLSRVREGKSAGLSSERGESAPSIVGIGGKKAGRHEGKGRGRLKSDGKREVVTSSKEGRIYWTKKVEKIRSENP